MYPESYAERERDRAEEAHERVLEEAARLVDRYEHAPNPAYEIQAAAFELSEDGDYCNAVAERALLMLDASRDSELPVPDEDDWRDFLRAVADEDPMRAAGLTYAMEGHHASDPYARRFVFNVEAFEVA